MSLGEGLFVRDKIKRSEQRKLTVRAEEPEE